MDFSSKPEVSIIILSYNHWHYTQKLLKTLTIVTDVFFETILIDNGSCDKVQKLISEVESSVLANQINLKCIYNSENIGISSGRNQGVSLALSDYLLFLDNDVEIIDSTWLCNLIDDYKKHKNIGIMGSMLLNPNPMKTVQFVGGNVTRNGKVTYFTEPIIECKISSNIVLSQFCIGACLLTTKDIWNLIGGFNTEYDPMDYEDIDFCLMLTKKVNKKCAISMNSRIVHHGHITTGTKDFRRMRQYLVSGRIFLRRWKDILI
jgi:GT2 family glycosyltransferase